VRAFDDSNVHHVSGTIDPKRDIEIINLELIFADLETIDKRIGDNQKKVRAGEKEAKAREEIYNRVKAQLEAGMIVSLMDMEDEERLMIADLHLLTNKPFIYAVNVAEDAINTPESELRAITGITDTQIPVLPVSAKIEMDMLEFSEEDKKMFLADMGVEFNPMDAIIKTCYDLLGLQYYFTAGEIEVRAWTIKKGWTAPEAA
jgi:ribosome-binding ATPase YchF (GTP1/OBG family)